MKISCQEIKEFEANNLVTLNNTCHSEEDLFIVFMNCDGSYESYLAALSTRVVLASTQNLQLYCSGIVQLDCTILKIIIERIYLTF